MVYVLLEYIRLPVFCSHPGTGVHCQTALRSVVGRGSLNFVTDSSFISTLALRSIKCTINRPYFTIEIPGLCHYNLMFLAMSQLAYLQIIV